MINSEFFNVKSIVEGTTQFPVSATPAPQKNNTIKKVALAILATLAAIVAVAAAIGIVALALTATVYLALPILITALVVGAIAFTILYCKRRSIVNQENQIQMSNRYQNAAIVNMPAMVISDQTLQTELDLLRSVPKLSARQGNKSVQKNIQKYQASKSTREAYKALKRLQNGTQPSWIKLDKDDVIFANSKYTLADLFKQVNRELVGGQSSMRIEGFQYKHAQSTANTMYDKIKELEGSQKDEVAKELLSCFQQGALFDLTDELKKVLDLPNLNLNLGTPATKVDFPEILIAHFVSPRDKQSLSIMDFALNDTIPDDDKINHCATVRGYFHINYQTREAHWTWKIINVTDLLKHK